MIETVDLNRALEESALFRNLKAHELDVVAGLVREGGCPRGSLLFREKDPSDGLYIVRAGAVAVEKALAAGVRWRIASLGPGEVLGEIGLICNLPRSADAVVLEDLQYWTMSHAEFDRLYVSQPVLAAHILRNVATVLSHRLTSTNAQIARLLEKLHREGHPSEDMHELFVDVWARSLDLGHPAV
jgi:CRP-like cAMP-binding protein